MISLHLSFFFYQMTCRKNALHDPASRRDTVPSELPEASSGGFRAPSVRMDEGPSSPFLQRPPSNGLSSLTRPSESIPLPFAPSRSSVGTGELFSERLRRETHTLRDAVDMEASPRNDSATSEDQPYEDVSYSTPSLCSDASFEDRPTMTTTSSLSSRRLLDPSSPPTAMLPTTRLQERSPLDRRPYFNQRSPEDQPTFGHRRRQIAASGPVSLPSQSPLSFKPPGRNLAPRFSRSLWSEDAIMGQRVSPGVSVMHSESTTGPRTATITVKSPPATGSSRTSTSSTGEIVYEDVDSSPSIGSTWRGGDPRPSPLHEQLERKHQDRLRTPLATSSLSLSGRSSFGEGLRLVRPLSKST